MQLKKGTYLQGEKYRVISTLGQGGFGITYLAEQVLAKRLVCIKEFFPKEYYNRDADSLHVTLGSQGSAKMMNAYKAKFIKEAQTIANLNHPNIIRIFDVFEENGTAYYAMEYIEGESLNKLVKREGALAEDVAVKYIRDVASALRYIHNRNIMHLDVKPANIMLRKEDDSAVLIDFGLSKQYDNAGEQTSTTPVGISHGYAPMEQYQVGGVSTFSPVTDIYSLGATLYYLVVGKVPAEAATIGEVGIGELPAHLSTRVRNVIMQTMSYWRKDRPQSIEAVMALLDEKQCWGLLTLLQRIISGFANIIRRKEDDCHQAHVESKDASVAHTEPTTLKTSEVKVSLVQSEQTSKPRIEETPSIEISEPTPQPMTEDISAIEDLEPTSQPHNEIWYTTLGGILIHANMGLRVVSNTYENDKGILRFDKPITAISKKAFYECRALTSVTLPDSVTSIGESAFYGCKNLTSVNIGNGVITIEESAFRECRNLTHVTLGNSLTTIGDNAFSMCDNLPNIIIPDSVITIGEWAFYACGSLKNITIPDNVTRVGAHAFGYCGYLPQIIIGRNVNIIQRNAFNNCDNIYCKAITPPTINYDFYSWRLHPKKIYVPQQSVVAYKIADGWEQFDKLIEGYDFDRDPNGLIKSQPKTVSPQHTPNAPKHQEGNNVPKNNHESNKGKGYKTWIWLAVCLLAFITIYASLSKNIDNGNSGIKIHYTNDDNEIGRIYFNDYFKEQIITHTYKNGVGTIVLQQNVTSIGTHAFYMTSDFITISLPNGIVNIAEEAFSNCVGLISITLPESIENIGTHAFADCYRLTEFKGKYAEDNGRILVKDGELIAFAPAGLTEYTIPNYVTSIGDGVFKDCSHLTSVTIPNSVTSIGEGAFYGCKGLTNVTIPDSVTSIGDSAFAWCTCLKDVTIPKNLTSFDESIFYGCDNLMSIAIPNDISTFGEIFRGCGVKELIVPDNITEIEGKALAYCRNLDYVYIPESVDTIRWQAFYDCKNLKTVMCESITPPKLGEEVFYYGVYNQYNYKTTYYRLGCKIYVPKESVKAYKEAEGWSEYAKDIIGYNFKRDPKRLIRK